MDEQRKTTRGRTAEGRRPLRPLGLALIVVALVAGSLAVQPAQAADDECTASGAVAAGWGGSRFVPVAPQGVGPSCIMNRTDSQSDVILYVKATGSVGGQIIDRETGDRFFCRDSLDDLIGQDPVAYPVECSSQLLPGIPDPLQPLDDLVGLTGVTMLVRSSLFRSPARSIFCSTTGEVGVLVDIDCHATFFFKNQG